MPTKKGPGQSFRKGLSLPELVRMFPDDATAEVWRDSLMASCVHAASLSACSRVRRIRPCRIVVALAVSSSASAPARSWPIPS